MDRQKWGIPFLALVLLLFIALGIIFFRFVRDWSDPVPMVYAGPAPTVFEGQKEEKTEDIVVDITGEVHLPGIQRLPKGSRLAELVDLAGGLTAKADRAQVNLAMQLIDGEHIHIPKKGEEIAASVTTAKGVRKEKVPINRATREQLIALPGIGPKTADMILEHRKKGPFKNADDLRALPGMGEVRLGHILPWIAF